MRQKFNAVLLGLCAIVLVACSAQTTIKAVQEGVVLNVRDKNFSSTPASSEFSTTSFGNYEFKAEKKGAPPMYGILPLKFNGGYLALDILFFAPAALFNLREVFPNYVIDLDKQTVSYQAEVGGSWVEYRPNEAEIQRARAYFGAR